MIESLSEAMGAALVGNNFSPIPSKISFHMEKNSSRPDIYIVLKLESVSQEWKHVLIKRARGLSWPIATAAESETPFFVLARPTRPRP